MQRKRVDCEPLDPKPKPQNNRPKPALEEFSQKAISALLSWLPSSKMETLAYIAENPGTFIVLIVPCMFLWDPEAGPNLRSKMEARVFGTRLGNMF